MVRRNAAERGSTVGTRPPGITAPPTGSPSIAVASVFGPGNASVRARVLEPLVRLGLAHALTSYFPGARTVREGLRRPGSVWNGQTRLRRLARSRPDVLVLNREASPFGRGGIEATLLGRARRGVLDIDDALHLDPRRGPLGRLLAKPEKATRAARAADVVIAGNPFLAEWAAGLADEVHMIPTCVDPSRYRRKEDFQLHDPPRLVWMGTRSGEQYLRAIAPALDAAHRATGARLTIIGDSSAAVPPELRPFTDRRAWSLGAAHTALADYDVGIMPLLDTPYELGKCAYKLLEYGASDLPSVATPVGANRPIIESAQALGPRLSEWRDALLEILAASADRREAWGRRLGETVRTDYAFATWLPAWQVAVLGRDVPAPSAAA